jgi:hypothetical protein
MVAGCSQPLPPTVCRDDRQMIQLDRVRFKEIQHPPGPGGKLRWVAFARPEACGRPLRDL